MPRLLRRVDRPRPLHRALLLASALLAHGAAIAQNAPAGPSAPPLAAPALESSSIGARIQDIRASDRYDETTRNRLLELYRAIEASREAAAAARVRLDAMRSELTTPETKPEKPPGEIPRTLADLRINPERTSAAQAEALLLAARAELSAASARSDALAQQSEVERERPAKARSEIEEKLRQQREIREQLSRLQTSDGGGEIAEAERSWRTAQLESSAASIELLNQELATNELRRRRIDAQRAIAQGELAIVQARSRLLEAFLNERRAAQAGEAQAAAEQARRAAAGKHPAVRRLTEENAALSRQIAEVVGGQGVLTEGASDLTDRVETLEQRLKRARQRLEIAGVSPAVGRLFIEQRDVLAERRDTGSLSRSRVEQSLAETGLSRLRTDEERSGLRDVDAAVAELMGAPIASELPDTDPEKLRRELRAAIVQRAALLETLVDALAARAGALATVEFALSRLETVTTRYREFLDEKLLWIPNLDPLGVDALDRLAAEARSLLAPDPWRSFMGGIAREPGRSWATLGLGLVAFLALLILRPTLRRTIRRINEEVGRPHADRFGLTVRGLAVAVLLAAPWPAWLAVLGRWLERAADGPLAPWGAVLVTVSAALLPLLVLRRLCDKDGVGEVHLDWPHPAVALVREQVRTFAWIAIPGIFVGSLARSNPHELSSSARLSFIVVCAALGYVLYRLLHPSTGVVGTHLRAHPSSLLASTRWIWQPLLVGAPGVFLALVALGYLYTGGRLLRDFYLSIWIIALAFIVHSLALRWLRVNAARLAWRNAVEAGATAEDHDPVTIDIESVNVQSLRLFDTLIWLGLIVALWALWSNLLPALGVLDEITLWRSAATVGGAETFEPITLANVVVAVGLAILFTIAARSLPSLIEVVILQRVPFTAGTLNAITTIARYAIIGIGVVTVFNAIGVGWSKVQWLVAAVSVGLGFGLQEIFANFVSGLIILFERPVRIGDTVTVGGITGNVTRIRIRATTIRDWDNKEHVIPNKSLITNEVTNWSLSDATIRVVIRVGIAYGSDTESAHRIMLDTAVELPLVLATPAPVVYFVGLGDSSLEFEVRLFVAETGHWFPTMHAYHMAIEKRLAAAGITIPFPQRDIHVRTVTPFPSARRL